MSPPRGVMGTFQLMVLRSISWPSKVSHKFNRRPPFAHRLPYAITTWSCTELKDIQLPFIMGVMADLAGNPRATRPLRPIGSSPSSRIDVDNFRFVEMKGLKPRVACQVPHHG